MAAGRVWNRISLMTKGNLILLFAAIAVLFCVVGYKYKLDHDLEEIERMRVAKYERLLKKMNVVAQKVGMMPIDDFRPPACVIDFAKGLRPDLAKINRTNPDLKVTIVVVPTSTNYNNFRQAIASAIVTTSHLRGKLEIVIAASQGDQDFYKSAFEGLSSKENPVVKFRIVKSSPKDTLFHEMLQLAEDCPNSDAVVFLTSEVSCSIGWLEALLFPILRDRENAPLFVAPHLETNSSDSDMNHKLSFDWKLKPIWIKLSDVQNFERMSEAEEMRSLAFLPDAFAVNRKSANFDKLATFFRDNQIADATSLDAAMYSSRCLDSPVMLAPCSRLLLAAPSFPESFEPKIKPETVKRVADYWLRENREGVKSLLGEWPASFDSIPAPATTARCKKLSETANDLEEAHLIL